MSVLVEFSVTPLDKGESVGEYIARCIKIVEQSGLPFQVTAMGTMIEGRSWRETMKVVEDCHDALAKDCSRITASIRVDTRAGTEKRIRHNVESVERHLGHEVTH
jgi:uncharacterized protein (TIGR00106 family)